MGSDITPNGKHYSSQRLLLAQGLRVGYGGLSVLWDISMEVKTMEIVALLGSNGAGKTTLLSTISGIVPPMKGALYFLNEEITYETPVRRVQMGITQIPEGRLLFSGLTVKQNLRMGAFARRNKSALDKELDEIFHLFPILAERKGQLAGMLSGGEQQMCAIGRGLMARPKLLLIDELSFGLAPVIVDQIMASLRNVYEKWGLSIVLVEQDVQLALEVSNRAYVLENGRIAKVGTSKELAQDPEILKLYLGI